MSYQVIARRWRPQDFQELLGQDHIRQTLINALKNNRLHHALLFTGPRGTGKTSTARILAKTLRCPNVKDWAPCGACGECQDIALGRSLDVIEIDGASNNGVDAIRELRETVAFRPSRGQFKLYIIDEVHMLSVSAFNALLKTLEEPPSHVIFVLATTEINKIPNTILSRCQKLDFRRISTRTIAAHLEKICQQDQIAFEKDALWAIARQGDGSLRDSQSLLDQVITFANNQITMSQTQAALGLTDRALLVNVLTAIIEHNTPQVMTLLEKLFTAGFDPRAFMNELLEEVRHLLMVKIIQSQNPADHTELVDLPDSEIQNLQQLGAKLSEADVHLLFDMTLKGANDLARFPSDPRLILEMVCLRLANAPRILDIAQVLQASHNSGSLTEEGGAQVATPPRGQTAVAPVASAMPAATIPPAKSAAPTLSPPTAPLEQKWRDVVERIKSVNALVGAQLENCFAIELKGQQLRLGVPQKLKFLYDKLAEPEFRKKVGNYVSTYWGPGHTVDIQLSETAEQLSPKALQEKLAQEQTDRLRQQVEAHPTVQVIQNVFKAEIKSIKEMKV